MANAFIVPPRIPTHIKQLNYLIYYIIIIITYNL